MPASMRHLSLLFALAAGAALGRSAAAEDGAPTPAEAYQKALEALPAPTKARGYRFTGVLRLNGKIMGYATLAAAPEGNLPDNWRTTDHFVMKGRAVPVVKKVEATFSRLLRPLGGSLSTSAAPERITTWINTEAGFQTRSWVEAPDGSFEGEPERQTFTHDGPVLHTLAATVLFCRLAAPKPARYAATVFEFEAALKGKKAFEALQLEVLGEQDFQGKKVWAVTGTKQGKELTVLLEPGTREVIAVRLVEGETRLEILPGDMWVMPARDALTAGMRGMFAFAAGDLTVLDDVLHWPSLHKQALAKATPEKRAKSAGVEAWRTNMLAGYKKHLPKRPAQMMQQVIAAGREQVKQEKLEGGRVKLTFGAMMRNMQFVVAPFDGVWQIVEQPGSPKPPSKPAKEGK